MGMSRGTAGRCISVGYPEDLQKRDGEGKIRSYGQDSFRTCFHLAGRVCAAAQQEVVFQSPSPV
jgi:hypothetical protein